MPVHEFPIERHPTARSRERPNYWGYDSLAFFSPHRGYMPAHEPGDQVGEFKEMVRELHAGRHRSDSRRRVQPHRRRQRARARRSASRAWRTASITCCNGDGTLQELLRLRQHGQRQPPDRPRDDLPLPAALGAQLPHRRLPLRPGVDPQPRPATASWCPIRRWSKLIAEDPMLADTKIIAEAWDAAGAYQVGSFANLRWAEWNGRYRDDVRRFWRGDGGMTGADGHAAGRLQRPVPAERPPAVSQHQLHHVARRLHAQRPGELRATSTTRPTAKTTATATTTTTATTTASKARRAARASTTLRARQIKNMLATLLLSQGVPMIAHRRRSAAARRRGNNNAYCQDNAPSWFDWKLVEKNAELLRFAQALIALPPQAAERPPRRRSSRASRRQPGDTARRELVQCRRGPRWIGSAAINAHRFVSPLHAEVAHAARRPAAAARAADGQRWPRNRGSSLLPDVAGRLTWRLFIDTAAGHSARRLSPTSTAHRHRRRPAHPARAVAGLLRRRRRLS